MRKVTVNFCETTGTVSLDNGYMLQTLVQGTPEFIALQSQEQPEAKTDTVIQLAAQGMTAEDLVKLKHGGVI